MYITISNRGVQGIDLSEIRSYAVKMEHQFDTGPQPYKLYAYLSEFFNNTIILDIGTEWGNSAISFSHNTQNTIISYDIEDTGANQIKRKNTIFKVMNFMEDDTIPWQDVSIILIDVDPHDGKQEPIMIDFLHKKNWSGILLLDDIGPMFPEMNRWFNTINKEKWMLSTDIGHYSGTGLVNFGLKHKISFSY